MTELTTDPGALTRIVTVDRARLVDYANASGDQNPIHQDEEFARSVGLQDVIAHGMWTMGAALDVVTAYVGGDPGRILSCATRFTGMVVVPAGQTVEVLVEGVVTRSDEEAGTQTLELTATCAGEKVLGRCQALVRA
ncbi:MaoC/PaaZ C-terminal domain-containing protein [Ornithinimicrobium cryptoxanthini]|uniref:MaoC family dehydratase N-terminal domain-containing protein n=1 Tax=Ornithinimicrobium cryptoxanthini TaxID=2934161 RepID=A0ABY4YJL0_9MICO|nr:MaoC/PaaZ C-terminal domain-containing protein [Ornithinimicrobium cryptoxanthini]USQ76978.1 MaoC family dehydratase N-terminal domain-containing protein [Ornithinimicrobium cryptoxanthini]